MQPFDITLKSLLQDANGIFVPFVTGFAVRTQLNVELPHLRNPRLDYLGITDTDQLMYLEVQQANDPRMPLRMASYFYELYRRAPYQVVLYIGKGPMTMPDRFSAEGLSCSFKLINARDLDGAPLLSSPNLSDNILAILTRLNDEHAAVHQILCRIATLEGE